MLNKKICIHCQSEILDKSLIDKGFCCFGCKSAYNIINKIGLSNYYKFRQNNPEIRKIKPENDEKIDLTNFVTTDEKGNFQLFLAIDGLHCAACVWLIESILKKQENIILARINLSKKYLNLKWQGTKEQGNKLVALIFDIGYKLFPFDEKILQEEERRYNNELVKSLAVAGFGAGNVMLFSIVLWFYNVEEIGEKMRDLMHFFSALIALPVIIYSSRIFFKSAFQAIKSRHSNMDIAISVAIFLACFVSLIQTFKGATHIYFDSALMLCFFLLIGRYLDFKVRKKTFNVAREFSLLSSNFARIIEDGKTKIIPSKEILEGMILLVAAGDKIAADGIIIAGESEIDTSIITGESLPQATSLQQKVFAGTINITNPLQIKVLQNQQNSMIAEISKIVEEVENHKTKYANLADRLSKFYTPTVHLLAFATFLFWNFFANSSIENAILNAIAVLIITCPCALALAIPITQTLTISLLLKKGILIKNAQALEKINDIDVFVFDKTGSLTLGRLDLIDVEEKSFYLKLASSLAQNSSHPIAKAICKNYPQEKFNLQVTEIKGLGLIANYEDTEIKLGKKSFITELQNYDESITHTASYLKYKDKIIAFYFQDKLKEDACELIAALNKKSILLSGDNKNIVAETAKIVGINEFYFEKSPLEKLEIIKKLKQKYSKIAVIGDGINDTACLALADVSISFSRAAEISKNIADILIQNEKLMPIFELQKISKRSIMLMKQNLSLALIYNLFALPFAIMGFVTPLIAAIAMSSSSIIVVLNSLRILNNNGVQTRWGATRVA
ncbi:MAG TPA: heavy metal translocating P-type ATPase metal-binding domain-containing protein [Rickettsiales bacterium]|nr:heavy metal translocating P-type ATPase metal-binding domain-containing protein [Rickettsiales bacterium]